MPCGAPPLFDRARGSHGLDADLAGSLPQDPAEGRQRGSPSVPGTVPCACRRGRRRERPGGGAAEHRIMKLVTMYYAVFRPLRAHAGCGAFHPRVRDLPRLVARSIGLVIPPAVLGELLEGRPPDDDEDRSHGRRGKPRSTRPRAFPIFRDLVQWQTWTRCLLAVGGNLQHQPGYKLCPSFPPSRSWPACLGTLSTP